MKKLLITGLAGLCVLTACGVDKEGTADRLVKDIETSEGVDLDSDQKDCVKQVVTGMSDDEITAISEGTADADAVVEFGSAVSSCIATTSGDGEEAAAEEIASDDAAAEDEVAEEI